MPTFNDLLKMINRGVAIVFAVLIRKIFGMPSVPAPLFASSFVKASSTSRLLICSWFNCVEITFEGKKI